MKEYRTKVQKNHRTFKRKALKTGKVKNNVLFDLLKPNVDLDSFDTDERKFYQDQKAVLRLEVKKNQQTNMAIFCKSKTSDTPALSSVCSTSLKSKTYDASTSSSSVLFF